MHPPANDPANPAPLEDLISEEPRGWRPSLRWVVTVAILAAALLAFAVGACAEELRGRVVGIADGDTVTVLVARKQVKVRISGIDAPEKAQPFGQRSRKSLSDMLAGRDVLVDTHKTDRYGRRIGRVIIDGHDVGLVQIERGLAWHYKKYEEEQRPEDRTAYAEAEVRARFDKRGLWVDPKPTAPWEWRREH